MTMGHAFDDDVFETFVAYRLVHLGINPNFGFPPQVPSARSTLGALSGLTIPFGNATIDQFHKTIEEYLTSLQGDWYRYAAQNYVVWTNKDLGALTRDIVHLPGCEKIFVLATVFTTTIDSCNGMLPQAFWTWLNKYRVPAL